MSNLNQTIKQFTENNDVSKIKTTIFTMAIRDCKNNPEFWNKTNIEEEVTELFHFLEKLSNLQLDE